MTLEKILETQLQVIPSEEGKVMHALKYTDVGFSGFGEVYFSSIKKGYIKAWKRHNKMILNLIVPVGAIKFVFATNNKETNDYEFQQYTLSKDNYIRLTVPKNIWFGFQGINEGLNLVANVANLVHDPGEIERLDVSKIKYNWNSI